MLFQLSDIEKIKTKSTTEHMSVDTDTDFVHIYWSDLS